MKRRSWITAVLFATCVIAAQSALADVDALNQQVLQLYRQGQYQTAIDVARQALEEAESAFGPQDAKAATSLDHLALLYWATGRYEAALPLYQRALSIRDDVLGSQHPDVAESLNGLAMLYQSMGRYDEALPLHLRALAIRENALGEERFTANSLNNLAGMYQVMGRYDEALPLYRRALGIREKVLGLEHPDTAGSLNNLAGMYRIMGRYDEALSLFQRALAVYELARGSEHPETAGILSNLAEIYSSMGRYDEALPLNQRALAISETALGPDHPDTAGRLSDLAQVYDAIGRYDQALPLNRRALDIYEKVLGLENPITAFSLSQMAQTYMDMSRYARALPLCQRALAIREKVLGPEHVITAGSLQDLALVYYGMGRYNEAIPLNQRALAIYERVFGLRHPSTASSQGNLAGLYEAANRFDEALALMRRAIRTFDVSGIPDPKREQGAIDALASLSANLAGALALSSDAGLLDEAIFYYKLSVNTRQRMRAGTRGQDTTTRESFTKKLADPYRWLAELLVRRGRIAEAERVLLLLKESELTEYLRRNGSDGSQLKGLIWTPEEEAYRQDLDRMSEQWREFEQRRVAAMDGVRRGQLSDSGPEMAELDQRRLQLETQTSNVMADATQRFVQANREANSRRERAFNNARTELSAKLTELRQRGDGGLLAAGLLLLPSDRGLMLIVTTEQGAVPLMRQVSEVELGTLVKSMREAIQQRGDYRTPAQALYRYLIEPAEVQLGGAKDIQQWVIMPFGNLRALPFAALVRADGTHLVEHYAVTMLTANGAGGLDGLETPSRDVWRGVALGASQADAEFGSIALPGVRREVCGVIREAAGKDCRPAEGIVDGRRYLDGAFTSDVLLRMLGPSADNANFLHIATHYKAEKSQLLLGDGSKLSTEQILKWAPRFGQYDLIALSACDSGVSDGAVESLAGVFRSRGAKAVLATLWPLADVGAAPMMVEFYHQRGERREMSKAAALRNAQRAMIAGRIRDESGNADLRQPYFWAPYVLMGNWL